MAIVYQLGTYLMNTEILFDHEILVKCDIKLELVENSVNHYILLT
jgi:hypothetical protein